MAVENCTFKTAMGIEVEAEVSYVPGFRKHPAIFYKTTGEHMIEITFADVIEFRKYLKMLLAVDWEMMLEEPIDE